MQFKKQLQPDQFKHWSKVEYLHETVRNPNIHIKGTTSYYSNAWTSSFEEYVVRYLYGDDYSQSAWDSIWEIDQLYIGSYVCIAAEVVILMGGNNTHRSDWFSLYPFPDKILESYQSKGDTIIGDGVWLGMRSMLLPGVQIGEGAIVASGALVTKDVEPYSIVAGNPARFIKYRFPKSTIELLKDLKIYDWCPIKFKHLEQFLCSDAIEELVAQANKYDDLMRSER